MTRNQTTAALCFGVLLVTILITYGAFVAGFTLYTSKLPTYEQTQATEPVNSLQLHVSGNSTGQQSYNDAAYFLQPTVTPQGL